MSCIAIMTLLGGTATGVLKVIGIALSLLVGLLIILEFGKVLINKPWRKEYRVRKSIQEWSGKIESYREELLQLSDEVCSNRSGPEKWSKKEILGHLIDSVSHFHHRCVQAQISSEVRLSEYDQNIWVSLQKYGNEPWEDIVRLWGSYNRHLLYLLSSFSDSSFEQYIFVGDQPPATLRARIIDYFDHLQHHLDQIFE